MAARIVTVVNQKGGCGKTMTAMQLGGACGLLKKRVLIIDMDRQGTSSIWSSQATDNPFPATVISLAPQREKMVNELGKFVDDHDLIIFDCPPAIDSSIPWATLQVADIALIPVIPVMDNIWATREAKDLALKAKEYNPTLRPFYLPTKVGRGNLYKSCLDVLAADTEVPMLQSQLSARNAYPESQIFGTTVHAFGSSSPAAEEVDALAHEVLTLLEIE